MKISHGIEYLAARMGAGVLQLLPHRAAVRLGGTIGRAAFYLWRPRRRVTLINLEIAFGQALDPEARYRLGRDVFANFGRTIAEIARFPRMTKESILDLVTAEGTENLREALAYGRGAILAGSHFGNWELSGAFISALGFPVDFLAKRQHNPYFDRYLTRLRNSGGIGVIHSERGMTDILRALKSNRQVAIVADQHGGPGGIEVTFFGRRVSVPRAPAALAVRYRAPLVTGYIFRNADGTHHCRFDPPLCSDPAAPPEAEEIRLTEIYMGRLEAAIRLRPDLWMWTHRRFKPLRGGEQQTNPYVQ